MSTASNSTIIQITKLSKIYTSGDLETVALANVSLTVKKGEFLAIMGPSGSGKSTLMHILGALDLPTSGQYILDGQDVGQLSDNQLAEIRNRKIGFIFQAFNLLPRTTALDNVLMPLEYAGIVGEKEVALAKSLLATVGLSDRLLHTPNKLSGGQQQRVAIARALVMNPAIILADEPTGNIASSQAEEIMTIFQDLNSQGHTIIMITHESDIAEHAKRIITIKDGQIAKDSSQHSQRVTRKL